MTIDFGRLGPSAFALHSLGGRSETGQHFVEFYENEASLVGSVKTYLSVGISRGEAAVVVASPAHRTAIEAELHRSLDLKSAREQGRYSSRDAGETLSMFMNDGVPDPVKFEEIVGGMIRAASGGGRNVRVFGEMVALLWEQGNEVGALRLEDLWNDLAETHSLSLFCAYPTGAFNGYDLLPVTAVCNHHTHVLFSKAEAVSG